MTLAPVRLLSLLALMFAGCTEGTDDKQAETDTVTDTETDSPIVDTEGDSPIVDTEPDSPIVDTEPDSPVVDTEPDSPIVDTEPDTVVTDSDPDTVVTDSDPDTIVIDSDPDTIVIDSDPDTIVIDSDPDTLVTDSDSPIIETDPDSEPIDTDVPEPLSYGDLLITEIMQDAQCASSGAEYFEVYNRSGAPIDLQGLIAAFPNRALTHVLTDSVVVPPGGYAMLARSTSPSCYPGADLSYPTTWNFNPAGNTIELYDRDGTTLIDRVNTTGFGAPRGASLQLDPISFDADANNSGLSWCPTRTRAEYALQPGATGQDYGTPGAPNHDCAVVDTGAPDDTDPGDVEFVEIEVVEPGDLVITELMVQPRDCGPETRGEYIELLNTTDQTIDLRRMVLRDEEGSSQWLFRALVEPGARAVGINVREGAGQRCAPIASAFTYPAQSLNNNGDRITLERPDGTVIDLVDLNTWPEASGRSWQLSPTAANDALVNDDVANWCLAGPLIPGAATDRGTPGTTNVCNADPFIGRNVTTLAPGDLVIDELMLKSLPGCTQANSQYIEIRNTTGTTIDLFGLKLRNRFGEASEVGVTDHVALPAGGTALGARFANPRCYPLEVDFWYPGLMLDVQGDALELRAGSTTLDVVDFRTWRTAVPGIAWELSPGGDDTTNDDPDAWCPSVDLIDGTVQSYGTPGLLNPPCVFTSAVDTADLIGSPDDSDGTSWPTSDTDSATLGVDDLVPGELVLTELMLNPLDCFDGRGEYIEVLNTTNEDLDLTGLRLSAGGQTTTVAHGWVAAGEYALGVLTSPLPCYNLAARFAYDDVRLDNAGSLIRLSNTAGVLDEVDTTGWPALTAASWQLDRDALDVGSNDAFAAWCRSERPIGETPTDRGTPGGANDACTNPGPTDSDLPGDTADTFTADTGAEPLPVSEARVGDLLITELMVDPRDCSDNTAEYFELTNAGDTPFDLDGLILGAGTVRYTVDSPSGRLVIDPGEVLVARRDAAAPCYDFDGDFTYPGLLLGAPNSDWLFIANETTVIDLARFSTFNVRPGRAASLDPERFTATPPGGIGDRPTASTFTATYVNGDPDLWCEANYRIPGAPSDKGSPGEVNQPCLQETDVIPHTGDYVAHIDELDGGELVITELMIDPEDCSDLNGEWIEILNVSDLSIALHGLRIANGSAQVVVSAPDLVLAPGDLAFGKREASVPCTTALQADFVYPSLGFSNGADEVRIANNHSVIDRVDYRTWVLPVGASLSLDEDLQDALSNDSRDAWCSGTATYPGVINDRGSPDQPNGVCAAADTDEIPVTAIGDVGVGDLVISEFLVDNTECPGANEQYIEILNTADAPIDLNGLRVRTAVDFAVIGTAVVVEPGERVVARSDAAGGCLDLDPDVILTGLIFATNGNIFYLEHGSTRFDTVNTSTWASSPGAALQLIPGLETATDNDQEANWCPAQIPLPGSSMTGTPGEPNDCDEYVDTDAGGDSDLGPQPVARRDVFIAGAVTTSPGVIWTGQIHRKITYTDLAANTEDLLCHWRWNTQATAVANVTASCPSCQFAFVVNRTAGANQIPGGGSCGTAFNSVGGLVSTLPPQTFAYSASYGALLYNVSGSLEVYAYDTTLIGTAFTWRKELASVPYY